MELKLKDFVDEESLNKLKELDTTIEGVRKTYRDAASELIKGLDIEVRVKGDVDRIQAIYNTQAKNVTAASDALTEAFKKQAEVSEQLMRRIREKAAAESLSTKEVRELSKASAEASKAVQQAAKAEEALNRAQKSANTSRKAASMTEEERIRVIKEALALADREVHSIEEANEANKRLRQAVRLVKDTDEDCQKTLGKLNATIGVNTDYVKRNSDRYTQQKMTIGDYKEQVKQAWMELNNLNDSMSSLGITSGSFGGSLSALGGIGDLVGNLKGLGGMMGNRWLLGLGAAGAAGAGIGWWVNYNKGLTEATRLTQQFTQKSGDDLKAYRTEVQSVADFYNKDFREVLVGANALSKQFGISAEESIGLIRDGFIAGADANGEFLDTLREYPAYFKEAGISAEAFIAITAQAAKSGIYSDKGVDVIKEGNIRIREMTDATAAALEGIGISADEVQEQLRTGQKTTFDIIRMVSERLDELPDSSAEVGAAIADIFGGPGEDAGLQYIRTLKDIKTSLGDVKEETGELGKAQEDMMDAQKRLSTELALLFDATGGSFETMVARIKSSLSDMTADLLAAIRRSVESVEEISDREEAQARSEGERYGAEDVRKQYEMIDRSYSEYVKQGLSGEEALKKAKEERLDSMRRALKYEEENLSKAVELNEKYTQEYQNASLWRQMIGKDRSNNRINADIESSWDDRMSALRSYTSWNTQIGLVESYRGPSSSRNTDRKETDEEKEGRIEAEKSLQESRIALMEEGLEKELATIRNGYERRISEVKGNSSAEIELRRSLQQEMERALSDAAEEYEKNRTDADLRNRLAIAEEGSEEELSVRLEILERQKEAEIEAAESNGADISLIEQKYLNEKRKLYERYAADEVEEIAKSAAAQQVVRNAQYNSEMKEMEKAFASGLISREEYENRKAEIAEKFSIDTAKAAVDSLEEQLSVENLSADEREAIAERLQKAKEDLANAEADAEIAAIKRVEEEEEDTYRRRMKNAQKWLGVASDAMGAVGDLMSALYERDIEELENQQEANEEAYNAEVERADALAESGAISEEEAEARKRAAEVETSRKNEELEKKKVQLQQKQAKWDKAVQLAQTGIATARGIMEAMAMIPPNPVLAAVIGAMGAVQVATIAATPIPAYKEGTKAGGHVGGLAVVGDGGRPELVVFGGSSWITPDRPTLVDLPKGAEVFPDISDITRWDDVRSDIPYLVNDNSSGTVVVNDYSGLSREMKGLRKDVRMLMKSQHRDARAAQYELYKRTRI